MDDLLIAQWRRLRSWLEDEAVLNGADRPSGLEGWTVGDLVAHLGLGLRLVTVVSEAPEGTVPLSLVEYVAAYPPGAAGIAAQTDDVRRELGDDVLAGLDGIAEQAFAHLAGLRTPVVQARRGPITRDDFVRTRLLELVVHGDDLARALGAASHPGTEEAVAEVAHALAAARPLSWIRLAAGRVASGDPALPLF